MKSHEEKQWELMQQVLLAESRGESIGCMGSQRTLFGIKSHVEEVIERAVQESTFQPLLTTLCYIEQDGHYLMLLRNKKQNDISEGKWLGVGGKFLPGETRDECLIREVREETGFELSAYDYRGVVHFLNDTYTPEEMFLYTATIDARHTPETFPVPECAEGTFAWIPIDDVKNLPLWDGDRVFLEMIAEGRHDIDLSVYYAKDTLIKVVDHAFGNDCLQ